MLLFIIKSINFLKASTRKFGENKFLAGHCHFSKVNLCLFFSLSLSLSHLCVFVCVCVCVFVSVFLHNGEMGDKQIESFILLLHEYQYPRIFTFWLLITAMKHRVYKQIKANKTFWGDELKHFRHFNFRIYYNVSVPWSLDLLIQKALLYF